MKIISPSYLTKQPLSDYINPLNPVPRLGCSTLWLNSESKCQSLQVAGQGSSVKALRKWLPNVNLKCCKVWWLWCGICLKGYEHYFTAQAPLLQCSTLWLNSESQVKVCRLLDKVVWSRLCGNDCQMSIWPWNISIIYQIIDEIHYQNLSVQPTASRVPCSGWSCRSTWPQLMFGQTFRQMIFKESLVVTLHWRAHGGISQIQKLETMLSSWFKFVAKNLPTSKANFYCIGKIHRQIWMSFVSPKGIASKGSVKLWTLECQIRGLSTSSASLVLAAVRNFFTVGNSSVVFSSQPQPDSFGDLPRFLRKPSRWKSACAFHVGPDGSASKRDGKRYSKKVLGLPAEMGRKKGGWAENMTEYVRSGLPNF